MVSSSGRRHLLPLQDDVTGARGAAGRTAIFSLEYND